MHFESFLYKIIQNIISVYSIIRVEKEIAKKRKLDHSENYQIYVNTIEHKNEEELRRIKF